MNLPAPFGARRRLLALSITAALTAPLGAAAQPGVSDALLAVENNRTGIVESVVERFGAQVEALGFSAAALREQLMALRADQLLAASLVRDLTALNLRPAESPDALQRYVAVEPIGVREATANAAALAYVVRIDGALKVVSAVELAALRAGPARDDQLVGYFVDARAVAVLADGGLRPKDGAGTGPNSWIGYTGGNNQATAQGSAVMAGLNNTASGPVSAVISGAGNVASGQGALIGGGDLHQAQGNYSVIVGGYGNKTTAADAVIVGGAFNENAGQRSMIGAGARNKIAPEASYSFIGGGGRNANVGTGAAGTNLDDNVAYSAYAFIGGGRGNLAGVAGGGDGSHAALVGGLGNSATGYASFVGGGELNGASGAYSSVGGGLQNYATNTGSFIGGGSVNIASGTNAVVAGGASNNALGNQSALLGGNANVASGVLSVVGGGGLNAATGIAASVPGGSANLASGNFSFAAGNRAKTQSAGVSPVAHHGAFVWADSTDADFHSVGSNTFNVRASGGVVFNTATSVFFGAATRQMLNLYNADYAIGVQDNTLYHRSAANLAWFKGGSHSSTPYAPGSGGVVLATLQEGASATAVTGTFRAQAFTATSDRAAKTAFSAVDPKAVLARVASLPIGSWRYLNDAESVRHIGPTAQDFRRAFGLGYDDKTIATVDADGVALAAIQGLNAKLEAERKALATRSDRLALENQGLRERLDASERALATERQRRELELRELRAELRAIAARGR